MSTLAPSDTATPAGVPLEYQPVNARELLDVEHFNRAIVLERKRAERANEAFLLLLLSTDDHSDSEKGRAVLEAVLSELMLSTRETDIVGWYEDHETAGVLFTAIDSMCPKAVLSAVLKRVGDALRSIDKNDRSGNLTISSHFFPDQWDDSNVEFPPDPALYPDLSALAEHKRSFRLIKRTMDVFGSVLALLLCAPLFIVIAIAIKTTSKGPVFFRQRRVGQYGKLFTMLKFRSMRNHSDSTDHQKFVTGFIKGSTLRHRHNSGEQVYKLTNDARVTAVGRFLRKTSLDELPQFINVLKGEMSLVGPRPPIPYELAAYQPWHRRRLFEVKPGITGPWQVGSRCRSTFDQMVRLDLRYAVSWTPWMDLQILLRTPGAVFRGSGAC